MPLTEAEKLELEQLRAEFTPKPKPMSIREQLLGPEAEAKREQLSRDIVESVGASMPMGKAPAVLGWVAQKTGLSKIPDKIMQRAVGMKKYIPGVGSELIDQGVVGTKGMMTKQVGNKLASETPKLDSAVSSLSGQIDSVPVANKVSEMGKRYSTSTGAVPDAVMPEAQKIVKGSLDIAERGKISPKEALEFKRIAGQVGYKSGEPLSKLSSQMAQQEGRGYGKALEDAFSSQNPGMPNVVADTNKKLSALLKGQKGLTAPESLRSGDIGTRVLKNTVDLPIVQSIAAQGMRKGAQALDSVGPKMTQNIASQVGSSQELSPEEKAELEQLRRELQ